MPSTDVKDTATSVDPNKTAPVRPGSLLLAQTPLFQHLEVYGSFILFPLDETETHTRFAIVRKEKNYNSVCIHRKIYLLKVGKLSL